MTKSRAIWAAYDDTAALDVDCPHCGAESGKWCSRPDGRVRKVPCIERTTGSGAIHKPGRSYRDFSEPIHPNATGEAIQ